MKKVLQSKTITTGFAIFSMLFGAGNLMYPIRAGLTGGGNFFAAMSGFLLASVFLPLIGLITIILFDGDYRAFFFRVGRIPGLLLIFMCMLIIGPIIAMPRIVTVSHALLYPYIPFMSLPIFAVIFLGITFIGAYRENKILDLLGFVITPVLLVALLTTVIKGFFVPGEPVVQSMSAMQAFWGNIGFGLGTLDLLGTIFFGAIIISILKQNIKRATYVSVQTLAVMALYAGLLGCVLLGIVYLGMGLLGLMHGAGFEQINSAVLFSNVSMRVLGGGGAFIIALAVLMAGFSTAIALSAVVAEYLQREICRNKLDYVPALIFVLVSTFIFSLLGLDWILKVSVMIVEAIGLPIVIAITFANLAYKLFGFKPIKVPVAIVALYTTCLFGFRLLGM